MSSTAVVVVPSFSITLINNRTSVPSIPPSLLKTCIEGKFNVTLTAFIVDCVTVCVTGFDVVTCVPIPTSVSIFFIPEIKV